MPLTDFVTNVQVFATTQAHNFGVSAQDLMTTMLTAAGLEGGLGAEAAVGDNGASVGRFQYNMAGGHGTTLLNQGYTPQQIAQDTFQVYDFGPAFANSLKAAQDAGLSGQEAIQQAIFNTERPAQMYPQARFQAAYGQAQGLLGSAPAPDGGTAPVEGTAVPVGMPSIPVVSGIVDTASAAVSTAKFITNPGTWIRAGLFLGGAAMIVIGIKTYTQSQGILNHAR